MKVINGVIHYTPTEVAQLCNKSTQIIKKWCKISDEYESMGEDRLIPAPHIEPNGYKYWSEEDTKKIVEYSSMTHKERYGNMAKKRGE
jgi:hypothetical protein